MSLAMKHSHLEVTQITQNVRYAQQKAGHSYLRMCAVTRQVPISERASSCYLEWVVRGEWHLERLVPHIQKLTQSEMTQFLFEFCRPLDTGH